eukprot:CAMPEP_0178381594 /NCGR_PEP_ID=MMETSP0689_2-20121128/6066_1 /TAXON_ID=160604 /ORGANISM="Amphidinium massartii, Strain CS-259" /LENGTH=106 /DNA_ID=CAMNT_0020001787 /DNA_START=73 /DNA_END=391 /DNA_ORIENTATION=-
MTTWHQVTIPSDDGRSANVLSSSAKADKDTTTATSWKCNLCNEHSPWRSAVRHPGRCRGYATAAASALQHLHQEHATPAGAAATVLGEVPVHKLQGGQYPSGALPS